jgi:hypothetical protein
MRKNALALSIAAIGSLGFVGGATADIIVGTGVPSATNLGATTATTQQVNNGGLGHALITPYFTAQNGNATLISIVNTDTTNGKTIKIRFRGGSNSDDILDFTILMSPGDVWAANISTGVGGVATLTTQDRTCTVPQLAPNVGQAFVTNRLTNKSANDIPNNTREGYVEIFNMADIRPGTTLFTAVKHVNGVPPCTTTAINPAVIDNNFTTEATAAAAGFAAPTGGLFGSWSIINVPQTTTFSGEMAAIRALSSTAGVGTDGRAVFVVFPQSASPYVPPAGRSVDFVTADPLYRLSAFTTKTPAGAAGGATAAPAIVANFFDMPDMSTPYVLQAVLPFTATSPLNQAAALTQALSVTSIQNEYFNDPAFTAKTDWLFSMPTRRYSVAMDYATATSRRLYSLVPATGNQYFHDNNTTINPVNNQQICVVSQTQTFYDREEGQKASGAVFSPGNSTVTQFCGETSILTFNDEFGFSALGSSIARQDTRASAFTQGWGNVNTTFPATSLGLPILGAAFIKATNPFASPATATSPAFSGTYGLTINHRFTRNGL